MAKPQRKKVGTAEKEIKEMENFSHFCWGCGTIIQLKVKKTINRVYCEECKELHKQEREETLQQYVKLKMEVMYDRALRIMEYSQKVNMSKYFDSAEIVHDMAIENPNKFGSSYEMIAAIILAGNGIRCQMQKRVGKRRVDILLPDLKVALEIDGQMHEFKVKKDSAREVEILNTLNENDRGWEMVRIPTKYIDANPEMIPKAVKAMYEYKQKIRRNNGGFIPMNFSKTATVAQLKATEGIKDYKDLSKEFYAESLDEYLQKEL